MYVRVTFVGVPWIEAVRVGEYVDEGEAVAREGYREIERLRPTVGDGKMFALARTRGFCLTHSRVA
jgi:hypothetical protein